MAAIAFWSAATTKKYDAGNMEALSKISPLDIYNFKRLEKPKTMNRQMLTRLFDLYGISSGLLASETTYPQALQQLLAARAEYRKSGYPAQDVPRKERKRMGRIAHSAQCIREAAIPDRGRA